MSPAVRRFYLIAGWTPISIPSLVYLWSLLYWDAALSTPCPTGFGVFLIQSLIIGVASPYVLVASWAILEDPHTLHE